MSIVEAEKINERKAQKMSEIKVNRTGSDFGYEKQGLINVVSIEGGYTSCFAPDGSYCGPQVKTIRRVRKEIKV